MTAALPVTIDAAATLCHRRKVADRRVRLELLVEDYTVDAQAAYDVGDPGLGKALERNAGRIRAKAKSLSRRNDGR
ncbi:hypothetical protein H2509_20685 [Stappia sp. F7233]|uniref:Uncharacterized protein n=1 Tax=Stappia albiluteola TaxID=2758565 RepID=A0A839AK87_9HYPH|nr:hypothetical protein [Stappia albiluteola]MBA5778159.1 hypothetical protein [Stappia albiluteola]MBA5778219.1 hypothetical protein [Stappia albiluteola]MBA5778233.1 hypothetical protein [Stappia albiluteola]MBA5779555.1 hypothetical protein [Stappia albiluteola]